MTVVLYVLLLIGGYVAADDGPVVEMPLGKVRGHTQTSRSGREFLAFTGLPYAKPPVGELRFQPPQPAALWRGIRDARENGSACIQYNPFFQLEGTEDCLFLDVYSHNISRKAPVLVMFHGGAFFVGTKHMMEPNYLMDEDIVVVQANYRLGIFGFLTFETKDLAGNQGLKDQTMVLRWVKQNIASFGGDPDRVTITGCSAGGASVHGHILSPMSRGLFHRVISESGSMYNPWALSPPGLARKNAEKLMTLLGCPTEPSKAIPCVMAKDANEIVNHFPSFLGQDVIAFLSFSPSLEEAGSGGFLEAPVSKWEPNPVPLMSIANSAEGLYVLLHPEWRPYNFHNSLSNFSDVVPSLLHYSASASQPNQVTRKVREFYFPGKKEITKDDFPTAINMFGDAMFYHGILKSLNKHKGDAYSFYFDYVIPESPDYKLNVGANHCAEGCFLWDVTMLSGMPKQPETIVKLSKTLVKSAVQFIENGTAKVPGSDLIWKKWNSKDQNYLHLDRNGVFSLKSGLLQDRYKFWESVKYQDKFD